jgi:L-phenylalanine/L-methionine N-acetyltransferase
VARAFPFALADDRTGIVREARAGDARACIAIVTETISDRPRTIAVVPEELWTPAEWRRHRLLWGARGVSLVAEIEGTVVGHLTVERGARAATKHSAEFGIVVAREARGLGAGRALLRVLEAWATEFGVSRIALGVFPDNDRAKGLYLSMGYEEEGWERAGMRFPEGEIDILRMSKRIGVKEPQSPSSRRYDERNH